MNNLKNILLEKSINVLHISDFHFSSSSERENEILVSGLLEDLKLVCKGLSRPDIIIFSGDLVRSGDDDIQNNAFDNLFLPILEITSCPIDRVIIAKGNHDASRKIITKFKDEHLFWRDSANDMATLNSLYYNGNFADILEKKFENHEKLYKKFANTTLKYSNNFFDLHFFESLDLEVCILNSATFSAAGLDGFGNDLSKLSVPEYAIIDLEKNLNKSKSKFFVSHHPLSWMSEEAQLLLKAFITKYFQAHFHGHMHNPDANISSSSKFTLFNSQAGALFQGRERYNGYSLLTKSTNTNHFKCVFRSFSKERRSFFEGLDRQEGGVIFSSKESEEYFDARNNLISEDDFKLRLSIDYYGKIIAELENEPNTFPTPYNKFVCPPLEEISTTPQKNKQPSKKDEYKSLEQLVSEDSNFILSAPTEYGRTSILKEIQKMSLSMACSLEVPRLPIFISFKTMPSYLNAFISVLKKETSIYGSLPELEALLHLGKILIIIDDVDFSENRKMNTIREFAKNFPRTRFILSSLPDAISTTGAGVNPELGVNFKHIKINQLKRKEIRELISQSALSNKQTEQLVDRLHNELGKIALPITFANSAILISIYEQQNAFSPINRAVLIEQFIEIQLQKSDFAQAYRQTFDFRNTTNLLCYIAEWMVRIDNYCPQKEDMREKVKEYITNIDLNLDINHFFEKLISARIFSNKGDSKIGFRYKALLEYFVALRMSKNQDFKNWILDETRYLSYLQELNYYAGIIRDDEYLINTLLPRFRSALTLVLDEFYKLNLKNISEIILPISNNDDFSLEYIHNQINGAPMTPEEKDEVLDVNTNTDDDKRQKIRRPILFGPGEKFFYNLLILSGALKNLEEITGSTKRTTLSEVMEGWAYFLAMNLEIIDELATRRKFRINGVLYEVNAPFAITDNDLARRLMVRLPQAVAKLANAFIGTEKLENQLYSMHVPPDNAEYNVIRLLRAGIIAELDLPKKGEILKNALLELRKSNYLSEALISHIGTLRENGNLDDATLKQIDNTVNEVIARLNTNKDREINNRKQKIGAQLKKKDIQIKILDNTDKENDD